MQTESTTPAAIIVQQGKVLDFIDRVTQRNETPEEYVRQEIAKSLVREYEYPRSDIAVEFVIRSGSRRPRADLVVFMQGSEHIQQNVWMVVECKASTVKATDRKEGVGQLESYMSSCPNCEWGMWTNGLERYCYRKVVENGKVQTVETVDIPVYGQQDDQVERPRFDQLKPASSDALLFAFRRCHNYIAGNQGLQKPEAFWELLKLIFCKIHDERNSSTVQFFASSADRRGLNGQMKVKARIERLFSQVRAEFSQIFKPGEEIELTPTVLAYIVSQLQMYSLLESDIDVKGRAYEEIVGANLRGDRGEFFTPRNICRMAVEMIDPTERQLVLDPACGTGGFLIIAMNHVLTKIAEAELNKWGSEDRAVRSIQQRNRSYLESRIVGIDLNPNLVKAAKMNMVMNNDGAGGIFQGNSLAPPATWSEELRRLSLLGSADVVVTNPPFGSKIKIDDPAVLGQYDLGHVWQYDSDSDQWLMTPGLQRAQPPEILFIERVVEFLRPGSGVAAMVLPDGILGSPGLGYVRQWLLTNTTILASIDMHPDTFQPSTSVQTSVLVFRRKTPEQIALEGAAGAISDYPVFMAVANHIGHDKRGNLTYVRDADGNEIVELVEERVRDVIDSQVIYNVRTAQKKVVDDNTAAIAEAFQGWLNTQL